jgi:hypothetical protein
MSLPTVTTLPPAPDGAQQTTVGASIAKRITPDIGMTLSHQWEYLQPAGLPAVTGLGGSLSAGLQYQFFLNAPHQAIGLVGVTTSFGHTGRVQALGAPDFTTVSPVIDFGKGSAICRNRCPGFGPSRLPGI